VQNLHTTNFSSSLDPSTLRERWLNAMPNYYFSPIHNALQLQQPLPPDWQQALSIPYLVTWHQPQTKKISRAAVDNPALAAIRIERKRILADCRKEFV